MGSDLKPPFSFFVKTCREQQEYLGEIWRSNSSQEEQEVDITELCKLTKERWENLNQERRKAKVNVANVEEEKCAEKTNPQYPVTQSSVNKYIVTPASKIGVTPSRGKRKKDQLAPKRTKSAYTFYLVEEGKKVREENPNWKLGDVTKELGRRWSVMENRDKEKYFDMAAKDRERYDEEIKLFRAECRERELEKNQCREEDVEMIQYRERQLKKRNQCREVKMKEATQFREVENDRTPCSEIAMRGRVMEGSRVHKKMCFQEQNVASTNKTVDEKIQNVALTSKQVDKKIQNVALTNNQDDVEEFEAKESNLIECRERLRSVIEFSGVQQKMYPPGNVSLGRTREDGYVIKMLEFGKSDVQEKEKIDLKCNENIGCDFEKEINECGFKEKSLKEFIAKETILGDEAETKSCLDFVSKHYGVVISYQTIQNHKLKLDRSNVEDIQNAKAGECLSNEELEWKNRMIHDFTRWKWAHDLREKSVKNLSAQNTQRKIESFEEFVARRKKEIECLEIKNLADQNTLREIESFEEFVRRKKEMESLEMSQDHDPEIDESIEMVQEQEFNEEEDDMGMKNYERKVQCVSNEGYSEFKEEENSDFKLCKKEYNSIMDLLARDSKNDNSPKTVLNVELNPMEQAHYASIQGEPTTKAENDGNNDMREDIPLVMDV